MVRRSHSALALLLSLPMVFAPASSHAEDLIEALVAAYQSNPRLMAERARLREVDETYVQARAQGRPTSNASLTYGYSDSTAEQVFGDFSAKNQPRTASLNIIQPIYSGGRVSALKRQATANIMAAREGLLDTEQNILLSAANAYLSVLRDEKAADIRRNSVRILTRQRTAAKDRFDVGEGTRTDIAQAESRLAAAEIGLSQADAQLASSRAAYVRVIGHPPENLVETPRFVMPQTLTEAMDIAVAGNPQVIAAQYNADAANANIDVAKSGSRPTVSLNGSLTKAWEPNSSIVRSDDASITARLSIPIFSGGANSSRKRAAEATKSRALFEIRDIERAVRQSVSDIWAQREAAQSALNSARKQVAAAEIAFEGVELELQVGTRSALDLLDAEQEVLEARLSVIDVQRNLDLANYQLLTLMGAFNADALQLPVDYYNPAENLERVKYIGMDETIDRYVPEPVQRIAKQLPNIPNEIAGVVDDSGILQGAEKIINQIPDIPADIYRVIQGVKVPKGVGKIVRQLPNIPRDIGRGVKSIIIGSDKASSDDLSSNEVKTQDLDE